MTPIIWSKWIIEGYRRSDPLAAAVEERYPMPPLRPPWWAFWRRAAYRRDLAAYDLKEGLMRHGATLRINAVPAPKSASYAERR